MESVKDSLKNTTEEDYETYPYDEQPNNTNKTNAEAKQPDGAEGNEIDDDIPVSFVRIGYKELDFMECCGEGSFGSVYRATWKTQGNKIVAVKKLNVIDKEAHVLSVLSHRNIIQFYGACIESPNYCIVTEYAPYGSLYEFLATQESKDLEFSQLLVWSRDIAMGMNYLHEEAPVTVIHRDLKSKNVVICHDFTLKICDFGASRFFGDTIVMTVTGTYPWMAPELIQGLPTSESCDVYSFGVVLWEMLTREVPFKGLQGFQVAWVVVENGERPLVPEFCPEKLSSLMRRSWDGDPPERPSFCTIVAELNDMMNDVELGDGGNKFMENKEEWISEINEKLEALQDQEKKLQEKTKELADREQKLKEWEEKLKKQVKTQKLVAAVRYRNEVKKLKCQISGKGEGAIDSVKDVISHIMSKSGLQVDEDVNKDSNFSSNNDIFKDRPSSSNFPTFHHKHPALAMRSMSSDKLLSRRRNPDIRSSIDFTNSKTSSDMDLFSQGLRSTQPSSSQAIADLKSEADWGHDFHNSSSNKPSGTTIQKEKTSAAFNFEGSKVLKSTSAGNDTDPGEPHIETWETAKGDADVQKSSENLRFGADGDLQQHQIASTPNASRRNLPMLPQGGGISSSSRSRVSGAGGGGEETGASGEGELIGLPTREHIRAALQRVTKPFDRLKLDDFVDSFTRELTLVQKQRRCFARSPKAYSFDCGGGPFSDHLTLRAAAKQLDDDNDNDVDMTTATRPSALSGGGGGKLTSTVSETSDVSESSEQTKSASLRRQTTTEFNDFARPENPQLPLADGRRMSTTRTRRSSEETCSSTSSAAQKKKSTKTERRTTNGGGDTITSQNNVTSQNDQVNVKTESVEETSTSLNREESSRKTSVKSEEVEEIMSSPIVETRMGFFPWSTPPCGEPTIQQRHMSTQTTSPKLTSYDKCVQTDGGGDLVSASASHFSNVPTSSSSSFNLPPHHHHHHQQQPQRCSNKNGLSVKIPGSELQLAGGSNPSSAPCLTGNATMMRGGNEQFSQREKLRVSWPSFEVADSDLDCGGGNPAPPPPPPPPRENEIPIVYDSRRMRKVNGQPPRHHDVNCKHFNSQSSNSNKVKSTTTNASSRSVKQQQQETDEAKNKLFLNRSYSSPGCFNNCNESEDDGGMNEAEKKQSKTKTLPHSNTGFPFPDDGGRPGSGKSGDSSMSGPFYAHRSCDGSNSPVNSGETRRVGVAIPHDYKRRSMDGCRPPMSSVEVYQKPRNQKNRLSRYQEKVRQSHPGDTTALVDLQNEEVILRKPYSSKARRYRIATPELNGDNEQYVDDAEKNAALKKRFRSGTRLVLARHEPSIKDRPSSMNLPRSAMRKIVPVQLRKPITPDFVDGTRTIAHTDDDEDGEESRYGSPIINRNNHLPSSGDKQQVSTVSDSTTTTTTTSSSMDAGSSPSSTYQRFKRSSSTASERSTTADPHYAQNRARGTRSTTPSRPRSGIGDWQQQPAQQQPALRVESPLFGGPHKVYQPREVYETDDYTFIICPQGRRRR